MGAFIKKSGLDNIIQFPHAQSREIHDLSCSILSGNPDLNNCNPLLYDHCFRLWKETWENVIFPEGFVSDAFFTAGSLLVLHKGTEVASIAIMNHYDLKKEVHRHNAYLKDFKSLNVVSENDSFMTIEYICAAKEWRERHRGFAKLLIALAQKAFEDAGADYLFGTARRDLKIDTLGPDYGFRSYGEIDRYGLQCSLMINSKKTNKVHPDVELVNNTLRLWKLRNTNEIRKIAG